ncbi:MAG: T9SS type A sorting domain-containing protein [Crocinitomicaceae bacterium]|nr:T9SS type A sorting domain-containing protein [Crocinitomicaceae bacterium]
MFKKVLSSFFLLFSIIVANAQVGDWIAANPGLGIDVAVDPFNDSYTCGQIVGANNQIGTSVITSNGLQDVVVQKYASNGALLWVSHFGGAGSDYSSKIVFDGVNAVWVVGHFQQTMTVGAFTLVSSGGSDVFIVKLDASNGAILMAKKGGGTTNDYAMDLCLGSNGNLFFSGNYNGAFIFPGANINSVGNGHAFLLEIDLAGIPVQSFGITGGVSIWTHTVDVNGNIYIGGFSTSANIGFNGSAQSMNGQNHFIAKFDAMGVFQSNTLSSFNGEIYGLSADSTGSVYFTGNFDSQASFGPISLVNGANDNAILVKINSNGNYSWAKSFGGNGNDQGYDLKCKSNSELLLTGVYTGNITFGSVPLSGGSNFRAYLAEIDTSGQVSSVIAGSSSASSVIASSLTFFGNDIYLSGSASGNVNMAGLSSSVSASFMIKIAGNSNAISGKVFQDVNNNALMDVAEVGLPNVLVQVTNGSYQALSANNGLYEVYANAGTYAVNIPNIPLYHTLSTPPLQNAIFVGLGNVDSLNHFGLVPTPNMPDLRVTLTPTTAPKAGYVLAYMLSYKNVGTVAQNATVIFTPPAGINFLAASPAPTVQIANNVQWQLGVLQPGQQGDIFIQFNIPVGTSIGYPLASQVQITPIVGDLTANDNVSISQIQVVGPYDPNLKLVDKDTLYNVSSADWLEYTVHFQNVGNDTAYNVVIIDTLSSFLDLASFELLAMSHQALEVNFNGQVMTLRFNQIMLPDSSTNQVASNGFVKFRLKHPASFPFLSEINNFVDIYFDFNDAIRTNTATTVHLDSSLSQILSVEQKDGLTIFPNPTSADLTIKLAKSMNETKQVILTDLSGRVHLVETMNEQETTINTSSLKPGFYIVQVKSGSSQWSARFVKI